MPEVAILNYPAVLCLLRIIKIFSYPLQLSINKCCKALDIIILIGTFLSKLLPVILVILDYCTW